MELVIRFFSSITDVCPIGEERRIVPVFNENDLPNFRAKDGGVIPWGKEDTVYIEAELDGVPVGNDMYGKYRLGLKGNSDYSNFRTCKNGRFFDEKREKSVARVQLLRGADGGACLVLSYRISTAENSPETDIVFYDIIVRPRREKTTVFHLMVDEMLPVNPFGVLSDFDGLSRTNILKKWERVSRVATNWYVITRVKECENQIRLMRPYFFDAVESKC